MTSRVYCVPKTKEKEKKLRNGETQEKKKKWQNQTSVQVDASAEKKRKVELKKRRRVEENERGDILEVASTGESPFLLLVSALQLVSPSLLFQSRDRSIRFTVDSNFAIFFNSVKVRVEHPLCPSRRLSHIVVQVARKSLN